MFHLPTKIVFGPESSSDTLLRQLGHKPLIVTGAGSAHKSGALSDLLTAIGSSDPVIYSGISENPDLQSIIIGKELMLHHGCDHVIGIGGGSPLDAAKAISIAAANKLGIDDIYATDKFIQAFPIVAIPTTSGTGSEVTQYSVLTDLRAGKKAGWGHTLAFPRLAIVDPRYTLSLPYHVTLNTAVDALSHLLEGLYSRLREPLIFPLIHKGIELIIKWLPVALEDPHDLQARTALSQASVYGGMTIAQGSTTLQHSIGYPLTTVFDVPHGLANGIVMKQMMELYWPEAGSLVSSALSSFGYDRESFFAWLDRLDMKAVISIDEDFISARVPEVMASRNMANNPIQVSPEEVAAIYRSLMI